jgi:hypothetical protein
MSKSKRVKTWFALRKRASIILGKPVEQTRASQDYVMTEVVHCKSRNEVGVPQALSACVSKWFAPMLAVSSARLIIVSGQPAGMAVKRALNEILTESSGLGEKWGAWKTQPIGGGRWPKSWLELEQWLTTNKWSIRDQGNHIEEVSIDVNGVSRKFTFMWMPHPVRSVPQSLDDERLYDPTLLNKLRGLVQ